MGGGTGAGGGAGARLGGGGGDGGAGRWVVLVPGWEVVALVWPHAAAVARTGMMSSPPFTRVTVYVVSLDHPCRGGLTCLPSVLIRRMRRKPVFGFM